MRLAHLILLCVIIKSSVSAQTLKISGEIAKPITLSIADIAKMKHTSAELKDHDGNVQHYSGVAMQDILGIAGVETGKQLRGENLTKYLMVKCEDGYKVIFTIAELDSTFNDRVIMLADKLEEKSLPAKLGPFRLVVPGEKRAARSCYQVKEFVILFAKEQ